MIALAMSGLYLFSVMKIRKRTAVKIEAQSAGKVADP